MSASSGSVTTIVAVAALLAAAQQSPASKKEKLDRAAVLLHGPREPEVREGAELCLQVGDPDAVKLLMKVLEGSQPHFRDVAFEVLPRFTDPYARKVVQVEFRQPHGEEEMRQWCAELLGVYGEPTLAGPLVDELGDSHAGTRAACARALGKMKYEAAAKRLEKLVTDKDPLVRANTFEALVRIDRKSYEPNFLSGLHDVDGGVRCALLLVLPELFPDRVEKCCAEAIHDADWRPRLQAVEHLATVKTKSAVEALIDASGDGRPVVAAKASERLQALSGKKFTLKAQWELWWKEARDTFEYPSGDAKKGASDDGERRTVAKYHGLEIRSDHVAFVIDKSADMTRSAAKGGTKDEAARAELKQTLDRLKGGSFHFEVVLYNDEIQSFDQSPVALDDKSETRALAWVERAQCKGHKAIWEVLAKVVSDPDVDTVYLLSSGEPEVGLYVHWNRVCDHLADLNRMHKVVVNTVAWNDVKWYRDQLEHIASATGGTFVTEQ